MSTGSRGQVLSIDEDRQEATVQAGIITVKVSLGDLIKAEMPEIEKGDGEEIQGQEDRKGFSFTGS